MIESNEDTAEVKKWLAMLMAPGSSLGGARPKANILNEDGPPWIAKFPSKNDTVNKAAWEYLAYRLASNRRHYHDRIEIRAYCRPTSN